MSTSGPGQIGEHEEQPFCLPPPVGHDVENPESTARARASRAARARRKQAPRGGVDGQIAVVAALRYQQRLRGHLQGLQL